MRWDGLANTFLKPAATGLAIAVMAAAVLGCTPKTGGGSGPAAPGGVDHDKLEAQIDKQMGGVNTCVVVAATRNGHTLYQYGDAGACMRGLPPCSTFNVANTLIGLEQGLITPTGVVKWDGTPQPVKAWETDADPTRAFKKDIGWWYQKLAQGVGHDRYAQQLRAFGYGDHNPVGSPTSFWMGPNQGGGLGVSTLQQVAFLKRLYGGSLPVKPENAAFVQGMMTDETRSDAKGYPSVMSGVAGSCASQPDGSRNVGWWIGRLKTPDRDLLFAASIESANAPPGSEIEQRIKDAFTDAGLWPAGS
jgi:beta-lactamase class D